MVLGERRIALSVSVATLVLMLSGCGGGEGAAKAADERFSAVEHVTEVRTTTSHGGAPWNTGYDVSAGVTTGLTDEQIARVVDDLIVIAHDELSGANVGVWFYLGFEDTSRLDLREVAPVLGGVGRQLDVNLHDGILYMTQSDLRAYESPFGVG